MIMRHCVAKVVNGQNGLPRDGKAIQTGGRPDVLYYYHSFLVTLICKE